MELNNCGFIEVGEWTLDEKSEFGITFELNKFEKERAIYAFVVDDKIKYIGICASKNTTMQNRFERYKKLSGESTNKRIAEEIRNCLKSGKFVKIFALKPKSSLKYKDLYVDLVKGLENPLIEFIRPEWNRQK